MRLMTKRAVAEAVGVSGETLRRKVRDGLFPAPVRLGPTKRHPVRWKESDVLAWLGALKPATTEGATP